MHREYHWYREKWSIYKSPIVSMYWNPTLRGGTALGPKPVVGGAGGHIKLEPLANLLGKDCPISGIGFKRLQIGCSFHHALQTSGSILLV